jgi:hypothetical protein
MCEDGQYEVLDFLDYDMMTHMFTLEVQHEQTRNVYVREMSDRLKVEVVGYAKKRLFNDSVLKPRKKKKKK